MDALGPNNEIEADVQSFDSGFVSSPTSASYVSSIASEIRRGIEENGRTYPSFGKHQYGLPIDEAEQDRNDFQHCKFLLILENKLFLAPISDEPTDILDLGTGSGIWCIDVADKYPTATVLGVDLAPIQPSWVPPNCHFEVDDIEDDWLYDENKFDFIHARDLYLAVRDWDKVIRQSHQHLKPGGWLELAQVIPDATSDDNTLPANSVYRQTCEIFYEIGEKIGASVHTAKQFKAKMEAAHFMDVQEVRFKIPCGPWPRDERLKKIGALERSHLYEGAEALLIRGMTTVLGRSNEEAQVLFAHLRNELFDQRIHGYVFFTVVIGRKAPRLDADIGAE
jgi:SAM-dependent methyltransferase